MHGSPGARLAFMQPWVRPLLAKYTEMQRLRRGDQDGSITAPEASMRALAREFPGALREIDEMPLAEIDRRVAHLAGLLDQERAEEGWEAVSHRFHALLRGALCGKHWLAGRKPQEGELREDFTRAASAFCYADDALAWQEQLVALASPPRGRLTTLVLERIAEESGIDRLTLDALIFPHARRRAPQDRAAAC